MIQSCHGGSVNDSNFGERMRGVGNIAQMIKDNFKLHCRLNRLNEAEIKLNRTLFKVPTAQISLF